MKNKELEKIILDIFAGLNKNNFGRAGMPERPLYDPPIIGVAAGEEAYYDFLKTHIGEFHWNPTEVFKLKYKDDIDSKKLRVVSMGFPQTEETRVAQRSAVQCPSDDWIYTRGDWEGLMQEFSGNLVKELESQGIRCVSIDLQPEFQRETSENLGIASRWSHRHTAFAAGLGTFGLSDAIITEKGMAIRFTSLIIEAEDLDITERTYKDPYEWCLYHTKGICGVCALRCPTKAISTHEGFHSKPICSDYEDICLAYYWPKDIEKGDYKFGCGICQAKVPCEYKRP